MVSIGPLGFLLHSPGEKGPIVRDLGPSLGLPGKRENAHFHSFRYTAGALAKESTDEYETEKKETR